MAERKSKPSKPPAQDVKIRAVHFDSEGRRIPMVDFLKAEPVHYVLTIKETIDHLALLRKWRQSQATEA